MERADSDLLTRGLSRQLCFEQDQFCAYFLSPLQFRSVAAWVGAVRARTYRKISPHGPATVDLDGRDDHYWHLLVWDRDRGVLAGSLRMALSGWHGREWDGSRSYLEHCYPGLDRAFTDRGLAYAEIGRTFVADPYQRTSPVLLMLLRAMASIPLATGHPHLLGMVSYNHFQHSEALHRQFLVELLQPPFAADPGVPPARHPFPSLRLGAAGPGLSPRPETLTQLEGSLEKRFEEPFRVPILLRKYMHFGNARVAGLSLARDFNQICEILMHCDLTRLSPRQRRTFLVPELQPVWEGNDAG